MNQIGRVIKGIGGFYTVAFADKTLTLKAAGRLRKEEAPLPGDFVECADDAREGDAFVKILPRRNQLRRPRITNVDRVLAVVSAHQPEPDYLLLDQLCTVAMREGITVTAILNKADLASEEEKMRFLEEYRCFDPLCISAATGEGIGALREKLEGVVCFAGQSGVGKSAMTRILLPDYHGESGAVSQKNGRGKHTTRHAELLRLERGFLVDTPGFSLMELPLCDPIQLREWMPEFAPYEGQCRFSGCAHDKEPGCAVKAAVDGGKIPIGRYQRYLQLYQAMLERWRRRYE